MYYRKTIHTLISLALVASLPLWAVAEPTEKISLRAAVEQALEKNLSLKLQQEDVQVAKGAVLSNEGKFDILVKGETAVQSQESTAIVTGGAEQEDTGLLSAEASKIFTTGTAISLGWSNNSYDSDASGLLFNPSYNTGLTLGLRQPLLKGLGEDTQTAGIQTAQKQLEAASFQVDSQAADLAAEVKRAYWNLVFAWQDIKVQKLSLTLAQKLLEETEAKINVGKLAPVELYQPQSEVARREEQLISAERAIGTAEDELKLLLNSDKWLQTFEPVDQPATEPVELDLPTILANALANRPDVKAADLLVEAARIETEVAEDNLRPDLALVGSVGVAGTDDSYSGSMDSSLSEPDKLWQIGLSFSMPLENSAAEGSRQVAKAQYNKARSNAELLRQQIRRTVRTTVRDVQLAIKALEATRKTSLATQKRLEAEEAKFGSGRATTLDVLTAQQAYSQALSQENQTSITYANTLAELDRIQGKVTLTSEPR